MRAGLRPFILILVAVAGLSLPAEAAPMPAGSELKVLLSGSVTLLRLEMK